MNNDFNIDNEDDGHGDGVDENVNNQFHDDSQHDIEMARFNEE